MLPALLLSCFLHFHLFLPLFALSVSSLLGRLSSSCGPRYLEHKQCRERHPYLEKTGQSEKKDRARDEEMGQGEEKEEEREEGEGSSMRGE